MDTTESVCCRGYGIWFIAFKKLEHIDSENQKIPVPKCDWTFQSMSQIHAVSWCLWDLALPNAQNNGKKWPHHWLPKTCKTVQVCKLVLKNNVTFIEYRWILNLRSKRTRRIELECEKPFSKDVTNPSCVLQLTWLTKISKPEILKEF